MPEDDEMLAGFAAAVDTTCETIEVGSEKPGRTDETDAMDVEGLPFLLLHSTYNNINDAC